MMVRKKVSHQLS